MDSITAKDVAALREKDRLRYDGLQKGADRRRG